MIKRFFLLSIIFFLTIVAYANKPGDVVIVQEIFDVECKYSTLPDRIFNHHLLEEARWCQFLNYRRPEYPTEGGKWTVELLEPLEFPGLWKVKVVGTTSTAWAANQFEAYVWLMPIKLTSDL